MLSGLLQFGGGVVGRIGREEGLTGRNPPVIVGIARREAAVGLERLAWQVAAPVAGLAVEHRCRIGQQGFGRLSLPRALADLGEQAGSESQLVAFTGQGERLQITERQEAAQIVAAVERAQPLDWTTAGVACGRGLIGHLVRELLANTARRGGVWFDEVGGLIAMNAFGRDGSWANCRAGGCVAGQLEGERLAGQRNAIVVVPVDCIPASVVILGDSVFGIGEQRGCLLRLIGGMEPGQTWVRHLLDVSLVVDNTDLLAPPIANGRLLEHVAKSIDLQRQRMLDTRVGGVPLVVVADRLARVGEEDGVAVITPSLQGANGEVLLGDGVGRAGALDLVRRGAWMLGVVGIDLLAQHRALESAAGFALFLQRQAWRDDGVVEQQWPRGYRRRSVRARGNTRHVGGDQ